MKYPLDRTDRLAALRIIAIYALFAAFWIYLSDEALGLFIRDLHSVRISVFKGFLFIIVTAALLYQLIARHIRKSRGIEKELRGSRNLINALLEGTTDAIFVKDRQGRYHVLIARLRTVSAKAPPSEGHDDTALFLAGEAGAIMAADRRVMEGGRVMTYEDYLTSADGIHRTLLSTKGPIFDATGGIIGIYGISHDITERFGRKKHYRKAKRDIVPCSRICRSYAHCRMIFQEGVPVDYEYIAVTRLLKGSPA